MPGRWSPEATQIDAGKEHGEHGGVERNPLRARWDGRRREAALGQSLVVDDEAVVVPEEYLHAIAPFAEEDEEVTSEGVEVQVVAHESDEAVMAAAKIDGLAGQVDLDAVGKAKQTALSAATREAT